MNAIVKPHRADSGAPESQSAPPLAPIEPPKGGENTLDRVTHALLAEACGGFSPIAMALAAFDWAAHLAVSPGRQSELGLSAVGRAAELMNAARLAGSGAKTPPEPAPARVNDRRFRAPEWEQAPFSFYADAFLAAERWWQEATSAVHGVQPHHQQLVNFVARQTLDMMSPSNFLLTNPVALARTRAEGGLNLVRGAASFAEDWLRRQRGERDAADLAFEPGKTVALTKGAVVRRTRLAEIIQYAPTTPSVRKEPVVIVPAWIMKYYILDLRPEDSLIRHLVDQGFTVFCISWRNPTNADRDVGFDDYRRHGVMAALDAALGITGAAQAHLVGYCIGGTLATIAAAAMARDGDERLKSLTLFAAQTDFEEAGELRLFIDDSQLAMLEDQMWSRGTLESSQMSGTFDILRSNDLIWSRAIHHYLMGESSKVDDLMAWSTDTTRMPQRMHSEYLRNLYLNDDLSEGRFKVDGRAVALQDIRVPVFAVGAERDTVAPWRSVFKIHLLASEAEIAFVLVNGGHNRGVVAPPGVGDPHYRFAVTGPSSPRPDPDAWVASAALRRESWWLAWCDWLDSHSSGRAPPPPLGAPEAGLDVLCDAPGEYVHG